MQIENYLKNIENLDSQRILKEWRWLVGDMSILSLTKAGDLLLKDSDNKLWFLDVGIGKLKLITNNFSDFFKRKLNEEVIKEILLPQLINKLESEYRLKSNEVFGYTLLPIFGVIMIIRICIHLIYMNIMNSVVESTSRLKIFLMEQQYK